MPSSRSAQYNALVDRFMRLCEDNNMTVGQATILFDEARGGNGHSGEGKGLARLMFERWRAGSHQGRVYDETFQLVEKALAALTKGHVPPIPASTNRPSQLIRRKGPALFTNGRFLYKGGTRKKGGGPRNLYRVDPDSEKPISFKEQLKAVVGDAMKAASPKAEPEPEPRHGPVKRTRTPVPRTPERETEREARFAELFGPLPPGIDDLLALRERIVKTREHLEQRQMQVEQTLEEHLARIQEVLTRPEEREPHPSKSGAVQQPELMLEDDDDLHQTA
jgi:hypothetical protein